MIHSTESLRSSAVVRSNAVQIACRTQQAGGQIKGVFGEAILPRIFPSRNSEVLPPYQPWPAKRPSLMILE